MPLQQVTTTHVYLQYTCVFEWRVCRSCCDSCGGTVLLCAGALAIASDRLRDASSVLEGHEGLGRWQELHGQLVARRNRLVAQLGDAFQVRVGQSVTLWGMVGWRHWQSGG